MRFIHITDTHIGPKPDHQIYGHPTLAALEKLVNEINSLPFRPDFVLHTGDVTDEGSEAAYLQAKAALEKLKYPVYYVIGNHDRLAPMQQILLGQAPTASLQQAHDQADRVERFDYCLHLESFDLAVFDSRGSVDPGGKLMPQQFAALRDLCTPSGPPLLIALHHSPVTLDTPWLDENWDVGFTGSPQERHMYLEDHDEFLAAIRPAQHRIRGVFFGHVHWGFQVVRDGILFCSAPSACAQLRALPTDRRPNPTPETPPGYNIVTVTPDQTNIRQLTFTRP